MRGEADRFEKYKQKASGGGGGGVGVSRTAVTRWRWRKTMMRMSHARAASFITGEPHSAVLPGERERILGRGSTQSYGTAGLIRLVRYWAVGEEYKRSDLYGTSRINRGFMLCNAETTRFHSRKFRKNWRPPRNVYYVRILPHFRYKHAIFLLVRPRATITFCQRSTNKFIRREKSSGFLWLKKMPTFSFDFVFTIKQFTE